MINKGDALFWVLSTGLYIEGNAKIDKKWLLPSQRLKKGHISKQTEC